jgi:hypothetical protein
MLQDTSKLFQSLQRLAYHLCHVGGTAVKMKNLAGENRRKSREVLTAHLRSKNREQRKQTAAEISASACSLKTVDVRMLTSSQEIQWLKSNAWNPPFRGN